MKTTSKTNTVSPTLKPALDWWAVRDDMGGFRSVAALLFPGWIPGRFCVPPHRKIHERSFSIFRNDAGQWRFMDHLAGTQGGLLEFVTLGGMPKYDASLWLLRKWKLPVEAACIELPPRDEMSPGDAAPTATGEPDTPPKSVSKTPTLRVPRIRFFDPEELRDFASGADLMLAGDCHVMRGAVFVLGGEPGVGKSRAATALAVAGATGPDGPGWFGLPVHRRFRTMIVQTENGRYRLRQEYSQLPCADLKAWVRVSEPPPFGLTLAHAEFREDIAAAIAGFRPDCVILDPWNAAAKDDKQRDYSEAFDALLSVLPTGEDRPAVGIVAHTRKPQPNEKRTGGTGLKNVLAGSYVLTSVPRCVFVMVRATEEETDDRVVFCNPKNNDGSLVTRTAWLRTGTGYQPIGDFDWEEFENGNSKKKAVTLDDLRKVFEGGAKALELSEAVDQLSLIAKVSKPTAYGVLNENGRFAGNLARNGKLISFKG